MTNFINDFKSQYLLNHISYDYFYKDYENQIKKIFMFNLKRKYSHITPRYIFNRIKQWIYERTHKDLPWLNKNGNEYLEKIICKDLRVVEFGGGRSSSFFLKKVQK